MQKIKRFVESDWGKDFMVVAIIILVGLGSFELGRLSKNNQNTGIKIEYGEQKASAIESINRNSVNLSFNPSDQNILKDINKTESGNFFASNRGNKYYSLGCSGGKIIKQENRIYFTTSKEAESAGYELSGSCK